MRSHARRRQEGFASTPKPHANRCPPIAAHYLKWLDRARDRLAAQSRLAPLVLDLWSPKPRKYFVARARVPGRSEDYSPKPAPRRDPACPMSIQSLATRYRDWRESAIVPRAPPQSADRSRTSG